MNNSIKDIISLKEDLKCIIFVLVLLCKRFFLLLMYQCGWTVPINIFICVTGHFEFLFSRGPGIRIE